MLCLHTFPSAGQLSESEAEQDGLHNEVTVPQVMSSRGNMAAQKSAIRLVEVTVTLNHPGAIAMARAMAMTGNIA